MSVPHKCPKCNGVGYLQYDPNMPFSSGLTSCGPWQCNVCQNGIIWETPAVYGEPLTHWVKPENILQMAVDSAECYLKDDPDFPVAYDSLKVAIERYLA